MSCRYLALLAAVSAIAAKDPQPPELRLPSDPRPLRNRAWLRLVPGETGFEGKIEIDLAFGAPTSFFWLNATDLQISSAVVRQSGRTLNARVVPGGTRFVGFAFETPISKGEATIIVAYRGQVRIKDDRGLFEERVGDDVYLFTQFENIDGRSAFPCFDEPSFKIPWKLSFDIPERDQFFGNTPIVSEKPAGTGMKRIELAETKALPAYLIAFAIGPFEVVDGGLAGANKTPVRIVVPRGDRERTRYAVATTKEITEALEGYFGFPYPYEKLDIVVVPYLVSFLAMENAGLVTIARDATLRSKEEETIEFQRDYFDVMTHEIAHQWFGNLVTMAWWDDVWLNEAFATWMEAQIINRSRPSWNWDSVSLRRTSWAMSADALLSARRVRQKIETEHDIQNAFDAITYEKGRSVLAMFAAWIGEDAFRAGLAKYFARHAHSNAAAGDFMKAISEAAGKDVAPAFSSFLDQPGVPSLAATLDCKSGPKPKLSLKQERYLQVGSKSSGDELWQIPVCVRFEGGRACTLLTAQTGELVLEEAKNCPKWVVGNEGARGYYHVALDGAALDTLLKLPAKTLPLSERLAVIRDARAMVQSGKLSVERALMQVPRLISDPDPQLQRGAVSLLETVPDKAIDAKLRPAFARFVRKSIGARARQLGFRSRPGDSDEVRLLRPALIAWAADVGQDQVLIGEAKKLAVRWLDEPGALEEDMIDTVLDIAAGAGDRALFERLRAELAKEKDPRRRTHLLVGLSQFRDPALVKEALMLFLSSELDPREGFYLLYQDHRMQEPVFAWVKENYDRLIEVLPKESRARVARIASGFCDSKSRDEVAAFFEPRAAAVMGAPRMMAQTLETIAQCIAQREAHGPALTRFLAKY